MEDEDFEQEFTIIDADFNDGIYILASRRSFISRHLEYRVAYVTNTDLMYNEKSQETIKERFGDKFVYKDEEEAITYALSLLDEVRQNGIEPEHGIGVIYKWEDQTFKKLIGG